MNPLVLYVEVCWAVRREKGARVQSAKSWGAGGNGVGVE